jgi:dTDP-4-dehydrorhamnose reductase
MFQIEASRTHLSNSMRQEVTEEGKNKRMSNLSHTLPPLELWGGVECTFNRVGDTYFDQLERNGHFKRCDDLDLFAELGIRAIRYPVSWERIAPTRLADAEWSWADERLGHLRALGIHPIVGLVHHGSGPRHTSLIEPSFADGLASFARAVAERYPWIESYTPVNEPLTTARFSGLYGHWYPTDVITPLLYARC